MIRTAIIVLLTLAAALVLVIGFASYRHYFGWALLGDEYGPALVRVQIFGGKVWADYDRRVPQPPDRWHVEFDGLHLSSIEVHKARAGGPSYVYRSWSLVIPTWALSVILASYPAIRLVHALRRRRMQDGPLCAQCGYSLKCLPEPRCPECGSPFDPAILEEPGPRPS
jgi:hypothetical protein